MSMQAYDIVDVYDSAKLLNKCNCCDLIYNSKSNRMHCALCIVHCALCMLLCMMSRWQCHLG